MKKFLSLILASLTLMSCISCSEPDLPPAKESESVPIVETDGGQLSGEPVYVTLDTGCDDAVIDANILLAYKGMPISVPTPTREGYIFEGWFKNDDLTDPISEGESFDESLVLYAGWRFTSPEMESMTAPVTVEYVTFGGTIEKLPHLGLAVESGEAVFHPNPKKENYKFDGWFFDRQCTEYAYNMRVTEDLRLYAKWSPLYIEEGMTLPVITIDTESGRDITDRDNYENCTVKVFSNDYEMLVDSAAAMVRGRGNSTWTQFIKKPFRLKFNEKTDLFGMGAERDYLLLANSFDMSHMRNYTAFTVAALFGDEVTSKCQFVHLYVNGNYRGLYLLAEQTEEGKNRVNIGDGTEGGTDVGYLVEFGGGITIGDEKHFFLNNVAEYPGDGGWLAGKVAKIRSPEGNVCTAEQTKYISDYVNRAHEAILTHDFDTFSELCDVESFLDCFIVNEILYPCDWGYNFFMYKPAGGKLHMGPLWDYDQSAGNSEHGGAAFDENAGLTEDEIKELDGWSAPSTHFWFKELKNTPEFFDLAREKYIENYEKIHSIPDIIYDTYDRIKTDIDLNFKRWKVLGKHHWRALPYQTVFTTAKEHVDYYASWITNRIGWLEADKQFNIQGK